MGRQTYREGVEADREAGTLWDSEWVACPPTPCRECRAVWLNPSSFSTLLYRKDMWTYCLQLWRESSTMSSGDFSALTQTADWLRCASCLKVSVGKSGSMCGCGGKCVCVSVSVKQARMQRFSFDKNNEHKEETNHSMPSFWLNFHVGVFKPGCFPLGRHDSPERGGLTEYRQTRGKTWHKLWNLDETKLISSGAFLPAVLHSRSAFCIKHSFGGSSEGLVL